MESIICLLVANDDCVVSVVQEAISHFPNAILQISSNHEGAFGSTADIMVLDIDFSVATETNFIQDFHKISPQTFIILVSQGSNSPIFQIPEGISFLTKPITIETIENEVRKGIEKLKEFRKPWGIEHVHDIGELLGTDLNTTRMLNKVIENILEITQGRAVSILFARQKENWFNRISLQLDKEQTKQIIQKLKSCKRNEKKVQIFPYTDSEKLLIINLFDGETVFSCIVVVVEETKLNKTNEILLSIFCEQIRSFLHVCFAMNKLLYSREEAEEAHGTLEKLHQELVQSTKLASIGELASGIAHDISTPLTCIIGFVRLFLKFLDKPDIGVEDLKNIRHYLQNSCEEAERCQKILKNLLLFVRKENKKYQPFCVKEVVERIYSLLEEQFSLAKVEICENFPENLPKLMGDSNQIQQVLMNLFVNAKNAMPDGGTLTIQADIVKDFVHLKVKDTGTGIPEDKLEKIFEPFFTTKPAGKGTGLGLSITHKIISEHGGKIYVETEVGKGTTFILELPTT